MRLAYLHYLPDESTALNHVRQFSAAARELGHEVDVHAMNLAPSDDDGPASNASRPKLRPALKKRLGRYLHEPKELLWNLAYLSRERALLRETRPDVLLVRDDMFPASYVVTARRMNLPLVIEINAPVLESRLYLDEYAHLPAIPEWLEAWKARRADRLVVVSTALRDYLAGRHRIPKDKFTVAPNGVETGLFRPDTPADSQLPEAFRDARIVGFVGSFQKFHGSDLLCGMALEVGKARPDSRFVFVGDGPGLEGVRDALGVLGDRVLLTGGVPHERVPGLVAHFDVAVLPDTAFYTSPLKLIEWMASGRAIVAPGYEPIREMLCDGEEGVLFPPREQAELAGAVIRLLDDADLRHALGTAASARASAKMTWKDNAELVLSACRAASELAGRPTESRS